MMIIIEEKMLLNFLQNYFNNTNKIAICFLNNTKIFFDNIIKNIIIIKYNELKNIFEEEISIFCNVFQLIKIKDSSITKIRQSIISCISSYLIIESHLKFNQNRINYFIINKDNSKINITINENDYIILKTIGSGSVFVAVLIYHIKEGKLFVLKKANNNNNADAQRLAEREAKQYSKIKHPFIPEIFGTINNEIVIEFINGHTLQDIEKFHYSKTEKYTFILQLLSVFAYLHENHFIYRDLKPNNVMIDQNKTLVLIDFDCLINTDYDINNTLDLASMFIAPEIFSKNLTNKSDVYSIGKMIYYIIEEKNPNHEKSIFIKDFEKFAPFKQNYLQCFNENADERPTSLELLLSFCEFIKKCNMDHILSKCYVEKYKILNKNNVTSNKLHHRSIDYEQNILKIQYNLGNVYLKEGNIKKAIHFYSLAANKNHLISLFALAFIYYDNKNIPRDINKAIHYFTLAADYNAKEAQFILGKIYYLDDDIPRDINKAIHYYTLAANQNLKEAQLMIGIIYLDYRYIKPDIKKAIHYLKLADNQNYMPAQYYLGLFYHIYQNSKHDINRAIYFYKKAASQNNIQAQINLGIIYYEGKNIEQDINKAINYLTLAANQNNDKAQFILGIIYCNSKFATNDINKGIYYLTLAANQNNDKAQYILGIIYSECEYFPININKDSEYYFPFFTQQYFDIYLIRDLISHKYNIRNIDKAIYYYSLSADHNNTSSQIILGFFYFYGDYITHNIDKAIYYFKLASNQNNFIAQLILGEIFYYGNFVIRDINKAIYYYSLAANQNNLDAQYNLGIIYYANEYVKRNINKAIHYFSLAADQNCSDAQCVLGIIYSDGHYVKPDINKSNHFLALAAKNNNTDAQCILGDNYIEQDINKAINYLTLAANHNHFFAQFKLGLLYILGHHVEKNMIKGIDLLIQSAKNIKNDRANFYVGYFYHEGKYVKRDIEKCIHYYKNASTFNNKFAKNNLGVIYKNGIEKEIPRNIGLAMAYFDEAIKRSNDTLSTYNLANIYIFLDETKERIDESIELLIKLMNINFQPAEDLLCIALIKRYNHNLTEIEEYFNEKNQMKKLQYKICGQILVYLQLNESLFDEYYQRIKQIDFVYDYKLSFIQLKDLQLDNSIQSQYSDINCITSEFYEGFGSFA